MKRFLIGLMGALALATPAAAAPDLAKMGAAELAVFMKAFPKGGELHNHLGGGTPAELILDWAAEADRGWCLAACVVTPGFRFEGFELAPPGWEP